MIMNEPEHLVPGYARLCAVCEVGLRVAGRASDCDMEIVQWVPRREGRGQEMSSAAPRTRCLLNSHRNELDHWSVPLSVPYAPITSVP